MESVSDTPSLLFGCLKLIKFLNISGFLDELPHFSCALGLETEISSLVCLCDTNVKKLGINFET